jgi:hypothetical protein
MECDGCGTDEGVNIVLEHKEEDGRFGSMWVSRHFCSPGCLVKYVRGREWRTR